METTTYTDPIVHRSLFPAEDDGWQFIAYVKDPTTDLPVFYAYAATAEKALEELATVLPAPHKGRVAA